MRKLATTTDSQEQLDAAVSGRRSPRSEPSFIYTEVGESVQAADGTIEHSEPRIVTDLRPAKPRAENFQTTVPAMTPEYQRAAYQRYQTQNAEAQGVIGDYEQAAEESSQISVPMCCARVIMLDSLNGPAINYYLAKHPQEAAKLVQLAETNPHAAEVQTRALGAKLATDETAGVDRKSYREYRQVRDKTQSMYYR